MGLQLSEIDVPSLEMPVTNSGTTDLVIEGVRLSVGGLGVFIRRLVEAKTGAGSGFECIHDTLQTTIPPGESRNILLNYYPVEGQVPEGGSPDVDVIIKARGQEFRKRLLLVVEDDTKGAVEETDNSLVPPGFELLHSIPGMRVFAAGPLVFKLGVSSGEEVEVVFFVQNTENRDLLIKDVYSEGASSFLFTGDSHKIVIPAFRTRPVVLSYASESTSDTHAFSVGLRVERPLGSQSAIKSTCLIPAFIKNEVYSEGNIEFGEEYSGDAMEHVHVFTKAMEKKGIALRDDHHYLLFPSESIALVVNSKSLPLRTLQGTLWMGLVSYGAINWLLDKTTSLTSGGTFEAVGLSKEDRDTESHSGATKFLFSYSALNNIHQLLVSIDLYASFGGDSGFGNISLYLAMDLEEEDCAPTSAVLQKPDVEQPLQKVGCNHTEIEVMAPGGVIELVPDVPGGSTCNIILDVKNSDSFPYTINVQGCELVDNLPQLNNIGVTSVIDVAESIIIPPGEVRPVAVEVNWEADKVPENGECSLVFQSHQGFMYLRGKIGGMETQESKEDSGLALAQEADGLMYYCEAKRPLVDATATEADKGQMRVVIENTRDVPFVIDLSKEKNTLFGGMGYANNAEKNVLQYVCNVGIGYWTLQPDASLKDKLVIQPGERLEVFLQYWFYFANVDDFEAVAFIFDSVKNDDTDSDGMEQSNPATFHAAIEQAKMLEPDGLVFSDALSLLHNEIKEDVADFLLESMVSDSPQLPIVHGCKVLLVPDLQIAVYTKGYFSELEVGDIETGELDPVKRLFDFFVYNYGQEDIEFCTHPTGITDILVVTPLNIEDMSVCVAPGNLRHIELSYSRVVGGDTYGCHDLEFVCKDTRTFKVPIELLECDDFGEDNSEELEDETQELSVTSVPSGLGEVADEVLEDFGFKRIMFEPVPAFAELMDLLYFGEALNYQQVVVDGKPYTLGKVLEGCEELYENALSEILVKWKIRLEKYPHFPSLLSPSTLQLLGQFRLLDVDDVPVKPDFSFSRDFLFIDPSSETASFTQLFNQTSEFMYVSKSACDLTVHEIRVVLLALSRSFLPSIFGLDPKLYELRLPTVEECLLIHSEYALALQERRLLDGSGKVLLDDVFVFKNEKDALSVAGHGEGSFDKNYAFVVAPKRAMDTPPEVLSAMGLKVGNVFPVTKEL